MAAQERHPYRDEIMNVQLQTKGELGFGFDIDQVGGG
jgi:hypothetical protein